MLPEVLREVVAVRKTTLRTLFEEDRATGLAGAWLPEALARKHPHGGVKWPWQYFFPAAKPAVDPESKLIRRHHVGEEAYSKAVRRAVEDALIEFTPTRRKEWERWGCGVRWIGFD